MLYLTSTIVHGKIVRQPISFLISCWQITPDFSVHYALAGNENGTNQGFDRCGKGTNDLLDGLSNMSFRRHPVHRSQYLVYTRISQLRIQNDEPEHRRVRYAGNIRLQISKVRSRTVVFAYISGIVRHTPPCLGTYIYYRAILSRQ